MASNITQSKRLNTTRPTMSCSTWLFFLPFSSSSYRYPTFSLFSRHMGLLAIPQEYALPWCICISFSQCLQHSFSQIWSQFASTHLSFYSLNVPFTMRSSVTPFTKQYAHCPQTLPIHFSCPFPPRVFITIFWLLALSPTRT